MEESKSGSSAVDDEGSLSIDPDGAFSFSTVSCVESVGEKFDADADLSSEGLARLETPSTANLRRRRSNPRRIRDEISGDVSNSSSDSCSSVTLDISAVSGEGENGISSHSKENERERENFCMEGMENSKDSNPSLSVTLTDEKNAFFRNLTEKEEECEKWNSTMAQLNSGKTDNREQNFETFTVTTANTEQLEGEFASIDSPSDATLDTTSRFLFLLAELVIKVLVFQISLLFGLFTFPLKLTHGSFMLVVDPFRVVKCCKELLMRICMILWGPVTSGWLKVHKSTWKMALRFCWVLMWPAYVFLVFTSLVMSSFAISGWMMRRSMDKPITMKESLNFDYTKNAPVAYIPIISCPDVSCGVNCGKNFEVKNHWEQRVIPGGEKLEITVTLTLPESDYNRHLGVFQVRIYLLSANGSTLASSCHPCMLRFKSYTIRLLLTCMKIVPLATGFLSESQTLNVKFEGFSRMDTPACLRVMIEQRAEFHPGTGIPQIYYASLTLESQLPPLKRFIWYWRSTIYMWLSMTVCTMQLLFMLICCKLIILPRIRQRTPASGNAA